MNDSTQNTELFIQQAQGLVGKTCWACVAGSPMGTIIHLHLGAKVPRPRPLDNPHLSEDLRVCEGEYALFVASGWRLDSPTHVICGSGDDSYDTMLPGLKRLVGLTIRGVKIDRPGLDVVATFESGLKLVVFCDETAIDETIVNYHFVMQAHTYVVGSRSILRTIPRGQT